ncbi:hypothetical protein E3G52_000315 [Mycobacteroides abscessus]|uniref:hypothetical protein n=1 Tax=Mycobacteroides abscessus TaxID=36809 RepID=UPI0018781CF5|nr:hypothetical protein [Mycobacteroides abscessus]MBE5453451.1 hypothetical protein [Mycobacteroides abscessus]
MMSASRLTDEQIKALVDTQLVGLNDQFVGRRPTCQCPTHADDDACTRAVTAVVTVHAIDNCTGTDTDPLGNLVFLLCTKCARTLWVWATCEAEKRVGAATRAGVASMCKTCQSPITRRTDVVRDVQRYEEVFGGA